jgi:hypothetical protein
MLEWAAGARDRGQRGSLKRDAGMIAAVRNSVAVNAGGTAHFYWYCFVY